jgi:tetratricopeptide (TPR) repeat protein
MMNASDPLFHAPEPRRHARPHLGTMVEPMTPKVSELDKALFQQLADRWDLKASPILLRSLDGGKSGANVFVAQISPLESVTDLPLGEYILKFDAIKERNVGEPREWQRHETARTRNALFGEDHVPSLKRNAELNDRVAMLYDVAGGSLASFVTATLIENHDALLKQLRRISMELLHSLNAQTQETAGVSARTILESLLDYRLDPARADLHDFAHSEYGNSSGILVAGRIMANALTFCADSTIRNERSRVMFLGLLHGDLHSGNILLDKARPSNRTFWIIDFAYSYVGPIGFDHSYLEVATMLRHFEGLGPERQIGTLAALELDPLDPQANGIHPADVGLKDCLGVIRQELTNWQRQVYPKSVDSITAQLLLNRVAAGLNWANKPLDVKQRRLAFVYASWAATRYLEAFHPAVWSRIQEESAAFLKKSADAPSTGNPTAEWKGVREAANTFNSASGQYVLVTGALQGVGDAVSLGLLPWSAVIDFDAESDQQGLFLAASPLLSKLRALQVFGREWTSVTFSKGTAWVMAGGWASHGEYVKDDREWGRIYPSLIRQLCEALKQTRPNVPVYFIIASDTFRNAYFGRLLLEIDSSLGDSAKTIVLGTTTPRNDLVTHPFNGDMRELCLAVRREYGIDIDEDSVFVPARGGRFAIAPDQLQRLEEDIEILHDRILEKAIAEPGASDEFWKGSVPSWADLHAGMDVRRSIQDEIQDLLNKALDKGDRATISFYHSPGAGGTTVALRAAWENRLATPVAILRNYSKETADRLDDLFHMTQAPVLLIAEASLLPETDREELYQALARRHASVIILHVVRTTDTKRMRALSLFDPMHPGEAAAFEKVYARQTHDVRRQEELHEIATSEKSSWAIYRSPFFFGLVTYQEDYKRVHDYVQYCLTGADSKINEILRILALVTRYSQTGLEEQVCISLLDPGPAGKTSLEKLLGPGPARLIVLQGRSIRLAHPVIALQVLNELMGGRDWLVGLKDLCIRFIKSVKQVLPLQGEDSRALFEDLFIERDVFASEIADRNFAPLIIDAGRATPQDHFGQQEMFAALTDAYPTISHYWNHRARHLIYLIKDNYEDAIKFLDRAIELGAREGNDMVHYQTKGLTYRFWVNDICSRVSQPPDLFTAIRPLVEEAFECFRIAHEKKPNSRYPFVTRIQLTIEVAEALVKAGGKSTIHDVIGSGGPLGSWLQRNYVIAVEDLEMLKDMRADKDPSQHETNCESDLRKLSGDFDDMVRIWETMLPKAPDQVAARRGLVAAYFVRGGRDWDSISDEELKRTAEMMDRNLMEDPSNEKDIRVWFQAASTTVL